MLRPATPLTILLLVSFVLLLLSVLSTPVIKGIPLASFKGVDFGVFGYCQGNDCTGIRIGYTTTGLFGSESSDGDFSLPSSARHSLSSLLIVHPVAAFLNLICLVLAGAAHLHSPSHSAKYLLVLLILFLPTLLVALLAFLVDVLLFVPHLRWGGWIVLASTIVIAASGVVTCAMRRTLVSRKARKRRIAENAEMSGENFFNRQNTLPKVDTAPSLAEPKPAMVNGGPAGFAAYETRKLSDEESRPLNEVSPSSGPPTSTNGSDRYGPPSSTGRPYNGPRDEFGNPLPPGSAGGPEQQLRRGPSDPRMRDQMRDGPMGMGPGPGMMLPPGAGRGGYFSRGRGGYGPPGRGAYPPRGGYGPGRGGYGPPPRGGPMGYNGRAGYGPPPRGAMQMGPLRGRGPPPGYPPPGRNPYGPGPGPGLMSGPYGQQIYDQGQMFDRRPDLQEQSSYGSGPAASAVASSMAIPSSGIDTSPVGLGDSPSKSVGRAVEMDATTGRESAYGQRGVRESDSDVQGMINLQAGRRGSSPGTGPRSPTSVYSQSEYIPPRAAWAGGPGRSGSPGRLASPPPNLPSLPAGGPYGQPGIRRASSDRYYEDVDPRFAASDPSLSVPAPLSTGQSRPQLAEQRSYDDIQDGARSPAASDISHFTSVSQRGVNPNWRPGPEDMMQLPRRPPQQSQQDVLLASNPDFDIPGATPRGGFGGRGGIGGGRSPAPVAAFGADAGRYPTAGL